MKNTITLILIILSAILLRLVPHVPNFAPVGAMALFGGVYLNKKYSLVVVFLSMVISDYLLLYVHPFSSQLITTSRVYPFMSLLHATTGYVYGSFLMNMFIGMWLKKHLSFQNIILASISSSVLFFLITNFGVWVSGMYAGDISGLWESYLMGLPFFRATVFGDLFYNGIFFSAYYIMTVAVVKKSKYSPS